MHDFLNTCILYYILMNMSIPKMNKNAVFIKNFTFRLRNISCRAKRGISCETYRIGASRYITRPPQRAQYLKKYILAHIVSI